MNKLHGLLISAVSFGAPLQGSNNIIIPHAKADSSTLLTIVNYVLGVIGAISVVVIMLAAVQYVTSQGDPAKIVKARNTIVYAAIGMVIAGSAFIIVNFVLGLAK